MLGTVASNLEFNLDESPSLPLAGHRQPTMLRFDVMVAARFALLFSVACASASDCSADSPSSLQRLGRWMGFGWGDGYHACADGGVRPGADLPPKDYPEEMSRTSKCSRGDCGTVYPASAALYPQRRSTCVTGNCVSTTQSAPHPVPTVSPYSQSTPVSPNLVPAPATIQSVPVPARPMPAVTPQKPDTYRAPIQRDPNVRSDNQGRSLLDQQQNSRQETQQQTAPDDWQIEPDTDDEPSPSDLRAPGAPALQNPTGEDSDLLTPSDNLERPAFPSRTSDLPMNRNERANRSERELIPTPADPILEDSDNLLDGPDLLNGGSVEELPAPKGSLLNSTRRSGFESNAPRGPSSLSAPTNGYSYRAAYPHQYLPSGRPTAPVQQNPYLIQGRPAYQMAAPRAQIATRPVDPYARNVIRQPQ